MEALMCEKCGLLLLENGNTELASEYLGKALWLFHNWGCGAKFEDLKRRFDFLVDVPRKAVSTGSLESALFQASRFGLEPRISVVRK